MAIEIGELRDQLSLDLQEQVQKIVDMKQQDPSYYILVVAKLDPLDKSRVNTTVFALYQDRLPSIPLLGTICVYVNNEQGRIEPKWCLPLDAPTRGITDPDSYSVEAGIDGEKIGQHIFNN